MYIEKINQPTDVKNLNSEQLHILADEMRQALLQKLSKHGGHFGPRSRYGRGDNRTSLCL